MIGLFIKTARNKLSGIKTYHNLWQPVKLLVSLALLSYKSFPIPLFF
jgi:hypothetical protein